MAKTVKVDLKTESTTIGYASGFGFVFLPLIEAFTFRVSMPTSSYGSFSDAGVIFLIMLGLLHAATIPGMVFGRTLRGTISIVEQDSEPKPESA